MTLVAEVRMSGEEATRRIAEALQGARECVARLPPDTLPTRNVHDGLRMMAACVSLKLRIPRKVTPVSDAERGAVLTALREYVSQVHSLAAGRLPDRRAWVMANAVALCEEGLSALVVPAPKLHSALFRARKELAAGTVSAGA